MRPPLCLLALGAAASASDLDAVALVQRGAAEAPSLGVTTAEAVGPFRISSKGPVAMTKLGPVQGRMLEDHMSFRGIPFVEPPDRFEEAKPKQPWEPRVLQARDYKPGCTGSGVGGPEAEDCLTLNIWLPKGGLTGMPVIVYFHGGMNMHGSGQETLRQGDGVVISEKYPTIFINLNYRLGIFGWLYSEPGSGFANNLGHLDQQSALRWVQENIAAFGGDPTKVALMGQSEGAGNIMNHVISPASAGLFWRAVFHSPPAEVWSYKANVARTDSIVASMKCKRSTMQETVQCLRRIPATKLWGADWVPEELSRNLGSPTWFRTMVHLVTFTVRTSSYDRLAHYLGWHAVPDGNVIPGEAHDLLPLGKFNKVPILLTVSRNESYGIVPDFGAGGETPLQTILSFIMKSSETQQVMQAYNASLSESGIQGTTAMSLLHQILTDKMFTCEAWTFAKEVTQGGGSVQLGGFWKAPRYDPVGSMSNHMCMQGATCHAAEMMYSLPQGRGVGIHGNSKEMKEELAFAHRYRDDVLSFVHGFQGPWEPYRSDREVITLYDENGPQVVEGYRKKQCAILDKSWADSLPVHMKRRAL